MRYGKSKLFEWNRKCPYHEPIFTILIGGDTLQATEEQNEIYTQSTISIIVTRLIKSSKNGEMLNRLKDKLNLTKEEIDKLIFEL